MTGPLVRISRQRWWRWVLLAVAVLLLVVFFAGWYLLAGSRPRIDGTLTAPGLTAKVTVSRDALGTATFTGSNRDDISYAMGYVHAQERFLEMDLMRRQPAGELSALVGAAALPLDLNHRRQRLRAVVEAAFARMPAAQKHELDRYRDGVNAGIADLRERPWEYFLLGTRPEPWRSEDSLLVLAAMYLDLNGDGQNTRELRLAQMRSVLPPALVNFLLAPDPDWEAPISGPLSPRPVPPSAAVFDLRNQVDAKKTIDLAAVLRPLDNAERPGSNNFAVSGSLTRTGAAMLANDMHLGLRVPNLWFRARVRYPDPTAPHGQRDAIGVTLPGTPALIVGSNGQIAWGFTNSYGDWLDWVRVQRDPDDSSRYKVPGGWAKITAHQERIKVKGQPDSLLKVEDTRWGPIISRDTDGTPLALAWIGNRPHGYNLALGGLENAPDVASALALAPTLGIPPQNLLVADSAGHLGWTIAGNSIPERKGFDPLLPADWSRPDTGWLGWTAATDYPRIENPANGRLWTANNRTVGGKELALLGNGGHDLGARAQQIRDDLQTQSRFRPGNLLDIQLDDRALLLTRWQRLLQATLKGITDPGLGKLRQLTAHWRGRAAVDSVDYRLVRAFRTQVHKDVLAPFAARVREKISRLRLAWAGRPRGSGVDDDPPAAGQPARPEIQGLARTATRRRAASGRHARQAARRTGGAQLGRNQPRRHPSSARARAAALARPLPEHARPAATRRPQHAASRRAALRCLRAPGCLARPRGSGDHGNARWAERQSVVAVLWRRT